uniref:Uncharacterized protein n=1 Tax=uncultured prokaryote TaxID=198431 RepID=A0A0H5Q6B4_9ZZZZ|nr:hypothetical protein [uncultured prokaryote]
MFEIITDWQTSNSPGGLSVQYFSEDNTIGQIRAGLQLIYQNFALAIPNTTVSTIRTEGRVVDATTGDVTSFWAEPSARAQGGQGSGLSVPNVAQILMKFTTDGQVGNRRVRGRQFIPGALQSTNGNGEVTPGAQTIFNTAYNAERLQEVGLLIWSRPRAAKPVSPENPDGVPARQGTSSLVDQAICWGEFAVQRSRR